MPGFSIFKRPRRNGKPICTVYTLQPLRQYAGFLLEIERVNSLPWFMILWFFLQIHLLN
jgi:hypothetical protein